MQRGHGLTLLELVVAVSLLTVVLLAFAGALLQGAALDAFTAERSAATAAGMSELEAVVAEPWELQPAQDGRTFEVWVTTESGPRALPPAASLAQPGRVSVVDLAAPDLRRVAVSVRWRSRSGADAALELETWVTRR
ncbi:MAG: prepilin-type N-terminal cleavage/methylation domain-containing protein [Planctomycetota bacterium]